MKNPIILKKTLKLAALFLSISLPIVTCVADDKDRDRGKDRRPDTQKSDNRGDRGDKGSKGDRGNKGNPPTFRKENNKPSTSGAENRRQKQVNRTPSMSRTVPSRPKPAPQASQSQAPQSNRSQTFQGNRRQSQSNQPQTLKGIRPQTPQSNRPQIKIDSGKPQFQGQQEASSIKQKQENRQTRTQFKQFFDDRRQQEKSKGIDRRSAQEAIQESRAKRAIDKRKDRTKENMESQTRRYRESGDRVRSEVRKYRRDHHNWFRKDFWTRHHRYPRYYNTYYNWWQVATPIAIGGWLGWNTAPYYYNFYNGSGGDYGYYVGNTGSYSNNYVTVPNFSSSPSAAVTGVITGDVISDDEWMPLGVFALSNGREGSVPSIYLQIALSRDGFISGTCYIATTDQTYEIEGLVDQQTQLAAWKIKDSAGSPLIETGLYNLTQSQAPARLYFTNGEVRDMLLVRLEEP